MDDFNYLDCYLAFQDEFKPIKSYTSQQSIIKKALDVFANVVEKYKDKKFIKNIKLLYPNYFTESADGRFVPIIDELIFLNDSDTPVKLNQLKARVLKHMSFYLTNNLDAEVEQRSFIRISKVLIENRKSSIHSFYVMKVNDSEKPESYYYRIYINEDARTKYEIAPPTDTDKKRYYPDSIAEGENVQGKFIPEGDKGVYSFSSDGKAAIPGPDADEEARLNESEINTTESFYNLFCEPLSAHYVMLENTSLLYVYSQTAQIEKEESTLGYGGMFVLIERGASDSEVKQYAQFFRLISDSISTCIAHNIMREKLENESRKSAKAAIMARNMSHNLGSHVMSYLKQRLSSETGTPFHLGLARFMSYLQERQDFIATISTGYIPSFATVSFKDAIYDELNPDKRYERHKDLSGIHEMNNILLGYIARSEGLGRGEDSMGDIILKYKSFDGTSGDAATLDKMRGISLSLPGGQVGRQAIFSIVENIIRNAAKHGYWKAKRNLELTFDIYDSNSEEEMNSLDTGDGKGYLSLKEVYDRFYKNAEDHGDFYLMTLTDNVRTSVDTLERIRIGLFEPYIDKGVMTEGNKGLKEMRISACWLRAISRETDCFRPGEDLVKKNDRTWKTLKGSDHKKAPLVYARISNDHLQYIICIPIPKRIAWVNSELDEVCIHRYNAILHRLHCKVFSKDGYETERNKSYDLIVCDGFEDDEYNSIRSLSSLRVFNTKGNSELKLSLERLNKCLEDYSSCEPPTTSFESVEDAVSVVENLLLKDLAASDGEKINVIDRLTNMRFNGKSPCDSVEVSSSFEPDAKYVYRTHHDTSGQLLKFLADMEWMGTRENPGKLTVVPFVEAISGGNSTDRLVRNGAMDEQWFYRHLHIMKQRVAVFDERVFTKAFHLTESDFPRIVYSDSSSFSDVKDYYLELLKRIKVGAALINYLKNKVDSSDELNDFIRRIKDKFLLPIINDDPLSIGPSGPSFIQKGVYVFSLIPCKERKEIDEKTKTYDLIGIRPDSLFAHNDEVFCHCTRLASLVGDKSGMLRLDPTWNTEENGFDLLSIHQGLLDKLYSAFEIDTIEDVQEKQNAKKQITESLYRIFMREDNSYVVNDQVFLPGMSIHSGRSKPSIEDMPQSVPFIQYAGIDYAVSDCKYSLVELIEYARYEHR